MAKIATRWRPEWRYVPGSGPVAFFTVKSWLTFLGLVPFPRYSGNPQHRPLGWPQERIPVSLAKRYEGHDGPIRMFVEREKP